MFLQDIQTYYQGLCESHTDILHGTDGRTAFFRLQGAAALNNIPNNLGDVIVEIERFGGRSVGEFDANLMNQFITLRFGKKLDIPLNGDFEAAIDTCMGECQLIMFDFISKMKTDYLADDCGWLSKVDFSSLSWQEYDGPWLENHYGWDLNIPFKAAFPPYRPAKWI